MKPSSRETNPKARLGVGPLGRVVRVNVGLVYCARAVADSGRLGLGLRDNRRDGIFLERVFENLVERAHVGDLQVAENLGRKIGDGVRFVICRQMSCFRKKSGSMP